MSTSRTHDPRPPGERTARPAAPLAFVVLLALFGAGLAALVLLAAVLAPTTTPTHPDGWHGYPPCEREDSPGPCYWDAETRGNGAGASFIVTEDGTVVAP